METDPEEPELPAGLEFVDPANPELGCRLIGKLSITDGLPIPDEHSLDDEPPYGDPL